MSTRLVAYFSATGVTEGKAREIADAVGGDLYEIVPAVRYSSADLDWMNKQSRSSVEMNDPECRPEIAGELPDCPGYDSVVIGYPIWWYTAPKIIRTFLERADLKGKRIDLFATSGSSGIGKSVEELQKDYPELQIVSGKLVNKRIDAADIRGWLA
jgi:flavodoxin